MIAELLESLKYVGHYFAIFFFRIYIGFFVLNMGLDKYSTSYITEPFLAAQINENLSLSQTPEIVDYFYLDIVRPHWTYFASFQLYLEIIAGLLIIFGFCVRPTALILILYFGLIVYIANQNLWPWFGLLSAALFALGWAGAGRCVGLDYYFYKRYRGFLW